jgi:hypothetical protein
MRFLILQLLQICIQENISLLHFLVLNLPTVDHMIQAPKNGKILYEQSHYKCYNST